MIPIFDDMAMASADRRCAKIPTPKRPEQRRVLLEGHEDSQCDDLLRSFRQAHADKRQARSKFAVIRRVESASPPRVPPVLTPGQTQMRPALPTEETSVQRFQRKARGPVRVETKTSPVRLPGKMLGFRTLPAPAGDAANGASVGGIR